jgi:hypothetical protein
LSFAPQKAQISSHWTRWQRSPRTFTLWYARQAAPRSARSLSTVPLATPVMRQVERIEQPSTKAETTRAGGGIEHVHILHYA